MSYLLMEHHDVAVMPVLRIDHRSDGTRGGPVWPDWEGRGHERHWRNGRPADQPPPELPAAVTCDLKGAFWCGLVDHHFGHQIAEFFMRVIPSRFVDPRARLLFAAGSSPEPEWFWDLLAWCNVDRRDVLLVRQPIMARQLKVVPQAEQLWGGPPANEHLDVMDRFMHTKPKLESGRERLVYVSRAGVHPSKARFAGEAYIEHCIRESGAIVLRPETVPVKDQLTLYRRADKLIFSEGSALHLLQLAGRSFHDVCVLERRPGMTLFESFLRPRCRTFRQVPVTRCLVAGLNLYGEREDHAAICVPDPRLLVQELLAWGCDVRGSFRPARFLEEMHRDVIQWVSANLASPRRSNWQDSNLNMAADLRSAGYVKLAERVTQLTHEKAGGQEPGVKPPALGGGE